MRSALLIGIGAWAFTWGAVLVRGTPARAHVPGGVFAATVSGAVQAQPRGRATFGTVAQDGSPASFSVTLDAPGDGGAVVFTGLSGERPRAGRVYRISEIGEGEAFQALYIAGSAERPRGVFRATQGTLEVISGSSAMIEARFRLEARGLLATDPEVEDRTVALSGWFSAEAQSVAVSSTPGDPARLP